ncbi:MAG TPA: tetraacyldisaccharide 4'-kinase [Bryobacteraceae bacterium]|nr:tetraacyldisaccharide 4'-kinase [Bryobacteraceae bacterium]
MAERLGFAGSFESTGAGSIWFHAVSVGEVLSAVELIKHVRLWRPRVQIYVSTTTLAGRALADQKLAGIADGIFFAPLDYRSMVRRVLRKLRPAVVVVMETEIWPNLYRESKRAGASLMIVNGRISDRALPRYRRYRWFFEHALSFADLILAQSEEDAHRFVIAGAIPDRVRVAGNLKYDFSPPASGIATDIAQFLDRIQAKEIWIAASTMAPLSPGDIDEDDAVLAALPRRSGLVLILAPRKPERFDIVAQKLNRAGISFARRSHLSPIELPGVLLLDSIGELAALFERADVVFMGGTLAHRGGHNILEPAFFSKPVIVGPHMENFAAMANEFQNAGAIERIASAEALGPAVIRLLDDPSRRNAMGSKARELAMAKRGVASRIAEEIRQAMGEGVSNPPRTLIARLALTPLSWIWRAGHRVNMMMTTPRTLTAPVISIGGLTMGGAGKSPMVAHLARRLRESGRNPAILTRGYRRESRGVVIVRRGERAAKSVTGDEAQIFIRRGDAHVGIGPDRFAAGRRMETELAPDVFLLDDGFQHVRLARRRNIVLIDALDPLAGGVFPLGRLREPLENLSRATEIVVTRVEPGQSTAGIERMVARYNAGAPIFRARVVPREWIELESGSVATRELGRVAAFCGLGSPRSFWRTLDDLGIEVKLRRAFGDHNRYRPAELHRLAEQAAAAGAGALVTTEKDAINLPENAAALIRPIKLYWLRIDIEIEGEEDFLRRIL